MKAITLIITALNEGREPLETIKSIHETADSDLFDIILFDDGSSPKIRIPDEYNVNVVRNHLRKGAPHNYDLGVEMARTRYVGIFNSRMRFKKGWLDTVLEEIENSKDTLYCTTSVILDKDGNEKGKRYGAEIVFKETGNFLNPVFKKRPRKVDVYEVPCVLGASYFTSKKWYKYINGFNGLYDYGGMCAFISLKSWVMGGTCKIIKNVEIGNKYREFKDKVAIKPYVDNVGNFWYNKMLTAFVLFDNKTAMELLGVLLDSEYYVLVQRALLSKYDDIQKIKSKIKLVNNVNNYIKR